MDCDLFRPCVYYTTGLPTINPIYLLYHRLAIWWHVHYTAGRQTFSWCIHLTTQATRVSPERLNDALHPLYPRDWGVEGVVSAPERLSGAPLVSYRGGCVWWLCVASSAPNGAVAEPQVCQMAHLPPRT